MMANGAVNGAVDRDVYRAVNQVVNQGVGGAVSQHAGPTHPGLELYLGGVA